MFMQQDGQKCKKGRRKLQNISAFYYLCTQLSEVNKDDETIRRLSLVRCEHRERQGLPRVGRERSGIS
jgi:hypothetical protein